MAKRFINIRSEPLQPREKTPLEKARVVLISNGYTFYTDDTLVKPEGCQEVYRTLEMEALPDEAAPKHIWWFTSRLNGALVDFAWYGPAEVETPPTMGGELITFATRPPEKCRFDDYPWFTAYFGLLYRGRYYR